MPNESWYREQLLKTFIRLGTEGANKNIDLFRVQSSYTDLSITYMTFIQPVIGTVFFLFVVASLILLLKANILVFVNGVYLICSFLKCIPLVAVVPLDIAFLYFAQTDVPMPYPWCLCFVLLQDTLKKISHLITTYLSILLAVNRYCSLYYPLQCRIWFSKYRNRIYCISICIGFLIVGLCLNTKSFQITEQVLVDDIWGNGDFKAYNACSVGSVNVHEQRSIVHFVSIVTEVVLLFVGTVCLGISNIIVLYKVRCISSLQLKSFDGPDVIIKNNNKRILILNKIFCLVAAGVIIVEFPLLVFYVIFFYQTYVFSSYGYTALLSSDIQDIWVLVVYDIFAPLDVFLFMINSQKVKSMVFSSLKCRRLFGNEVSQQTASTASGSKS